MKVYDTTNTYDSLVHDVWGLTSTDSTSLPLATIIRDFNQKYYDVGMLAWKYSKTWKFDDSNNTTRPQGTIDLVDLQSDYGLATTIIDIERVELLDNSGAWSELRKRDQSTTHGSIEELQKDANAGIPNSYDLDGQSIVLFPKPKAADVTLSGGLKLFLGRLVTPFDTSTTTTEPGFNPTYHRILSFYSAMIQFIKSVDQNSAENMRALMTDLEEKLKKYYAGRQSSRPKLTPKSRRYD